MLRSYFTQIPNQYDDSDLSVYAFRLLCHVRRVAGDTGSCYESARTLSERCKMSASTIASAKAELVEQGWITLDKKPVRGGSVDEMRLIDRWSENAPAVEQSSDRTAISTDESDRTAITNSALTDRVAITNLESDRTAITNSTNSAENSESDRTAIAGDRTAIESILIDQYLIHDHDHVVQLVNTESTQENDQSTEQQVEMLDTDQKIKKPRKPRTPRAPKVEQPVTPLSIRQALASICAIDLDHGESRSIIDLNISAQGIWVIQQGRKRDEQQTCAAMPHVQEYLRSKVWPYKEPECQPPTPRAFHKHWLAALQDYANRSKPHAQAERPTTSEQLAARDTAHGAAANAAALAATGSRPERAPLRRFTRDTMQGK